MAFFTTCMYSGRKVTAPNSDTPTMKPIRPASTKVRWRNRCSGMIGSAARRCSTTKPTRPIRANSDRHSTSSEAQGNRLPPRLVMSTSAARATVRKNAPM
ncbi:hypothetical protein D3C76_1592320 [compost metagenome]